MNSLWNERHSGIMRTDPKTAYQFSTGHALTFPAKAIYIIVC